MSACHGVPRPRREQGAPCDTVSIPTGLMDLRGPTCPPTLEEAEEPPAMASSPVIPVIPQHPTCPLSWRCDDPCAMASSLLVPMALRVPHVFCPWEGHGALVARSVSQRVPAVPLQ